MSKMEKVYIHPKAIVDSKNIGTGTRIWAFTHILKGANIGCNCNVGDHCYIENDVKIANEVVIKNGVSLWEGVHIEDRVFVGPNVSFTNDLRPRSKAFRKKYDITLVKEGASIGANSTLISPLTVGRFALIGGGAVVTNDVPDFGLVYGNPAHLVAFVCRCAKKLPIRLEQNGIITCSCGLSYQKRRLILKEILPVKKNK